MSEHRMVKLGELYEVHNGLSKGAKFFGSGYPFLSFSIVFNHFFIPDELEDLVQSTEAERYSYSIQRGDVFVTRTSETSDELGMSCVALKDYPHATYNGFTKRMRPTTDRVLPEYIGYYMRMPSFRNQFLAFSTMTTRASLRNEDLLGLSVWLPELSTQERIAKILFAYDSLIENNQRQIKLLEEAAQRLYREWFVDLRFPGHENVPVVDGVPEGWKRCILGDLFTVVRGKSYSSAEISGKDGLLMVNLSNIRPFGGYNRQQEKIFNGKYKQEQLVSSHDLIMGVTDMTQEKRTVGREALIPDLHAEAIISMDLIKLIPREGSTLFFYALLLFGNYSELVSRFSNGTNVLHLRPEALNMVDVILPSKHLEEKFVTRFTAIVDRIDALQDEVIYAVEARDRLLPKLMSGEIAV